LEQINILEDKIRYSATKSAKMRTKRYKIRDTVCETGIFVLTVISALIIVFIFIFILNKAWGVFRVNGIGFILNTGFDQQILKAFNAPANEAHWEFGVLGLLIGTLTTTLGALAVAIPMGIGTAIVIAELAPVYMRSFLQSVVRLLASIPSIIFALVGLLVVVPFIAENILSVEMQIEYIKYFQLMGNSMLAGIIVLSIMILPIIIALSVDAINAVPQKYREASLALGLSKWRTIVKVVLPAAKSGILAGIVLGAGRAIGEAIALSMVSGGIGNVPNPSHGVVFFLTPVLTLASAIVNKSETMATPSIESALFACGIVLLVTSTSLSLFTRIIEMAIKRREGCE
jgi:phosphate transport system permease protein